MKISKAISTLMVCGLVTACATQQSVHKEVKKLQTGPSVEPHKSITNFASGLRCMDNMMIEYGVRDVSMLVEDLSDQTGKINAGTKDMLITAVSDMTRRSRAVKLIPFGNDSGNLISFLGAAGSQTAYNVIPQYDIRGSISQLDSSVVREQVGGSIAASKWGLGASMSTAGSILGIDLSVLSTEDLSVIPGVVSSNAVVLFKSGAGADADATIKKTGISFDFQVAKNEATVQALRNLIELASIELVGRLTKVPYWQCLDIPEDSPEIIREMEDWYFAMRGHGELTPYVRSRLITRGHYPMNQPDASLALHVGVESFQQASGLKSTGVVDYATFEALITDSHVKRAKERVAKAKAVDPAKPAVKGSVAKSMAPVKSTPSTSGKQGVVVGKLAEDAATDLEVGDIAAGEAATGKRVLARDLTLELQTLSGRNRFSPGESLSIIASSNLSAYLYCFYEDAEGDIQRFFPNRFASDNFLNAGSSIQLPGNMPFDIVANEEGKAEAISCFASTDNIFHDLPSELRAYDFEALSVASLDDIRQGFAKVSPGGFAEASIAVETD